MQLSPLSKWDEVKTNERVNAMLTSFDVNSSILVADHCIFKTVGFFLHFTIKKLWSKSHSHLADMTLKVSC